MRPIRLAIVRCDTHAYWYAPFMVRCDGLKLQKNRNYVHCFLTSMYRPDKFIVPRVGGFELVNVWDKDRAAAERFAETFPDGPAVCDTLAETAEGIDAAFIPCCSEDGENHLELARPFLKKGIATFVDKPFASTLKDAKAIVALARKHKTPVMSASLLSYCDEVEWLRQRAKRELRSPPLAVIKGANGWRTETGLEGISHGVALALTTCGYDVESVHCMGRLPQEFMLLRYPDGRQTMLMNTPGGGGYFYARLFGRNASPNTPMKADIESNGIGDPQYIKAGRKVVKLFRKMVETRKPPIPYENMLKWVQVTEMGRRSQEIGRPVRIRALS